MLGAGVTWNISNVNPVGDSLGPRYGVSLATVGLFTTALFVTHLLAQLPGGKAADRFGARKVGLVAVGFVAAGNVLCLVAPLPALALVGRAVVGIGSGAGFVAGVEYMRAANPSPFLQGLYGGSTMAGGGLAIAIVPQLESTLGWRASYWTALAIAVAVGGILLAAPADAARGAGVIGKLVLDRHLVALGCIHAATFGLSVVAADWAVELLTHHGHGERASAVAGALFLLAGIVTRPLGGHYARRQPDRVRAAVAIALVAGALSTAVLALPLPFGLLVAAALVAGSRQGSPWPRCSRARSGPYPPLPQRQWAS